MEAFNPPARPPKPQPPSSALFEPSPAPRVRSNPQSTTASKKSHMPSLHHHRHHHHRHNSRHEKSAARSAVPLHAPTSFGDLLKQASRSKDSSPSHSRRESVAVSMPEQNGEVYKVTPARKPVRSDDVSKERALVKAQEKELRTALQNLSEQSLKTSRRLDDTYYSILEKVSQLRQTIASLQELCGLTKELHETFQSDIKELVEDAQGQFEGFNDFETQEDQVKALEERIRTGKEKADKLTARLAEARKRVEARAKLEAEWEATTSRRLRILWAILGTIAGIILIAICFQQLKPLSLNRDDMINLDFSSRAGIQNAPIPDAAKEALIKSSTSSRSSRRETPVAKSVKELEDDPRLHVFDEL